MAPSRIVKLGLAALLVASLSACGGGSGEGGGAQNQSGFQEEPERSTIWDLFNNNTDPNVTVQVNRFIWNASLEILDFMPVEAADPFSGIISFDYGTPPGGGQAYRATVYITDPALDARSLRVALQTRGGAVNRDTTRQIEDAILTRARQLRIRDGDL